MHGGALKDSSPVNNSLRDLFREVADLPRAERERILTERGASTEVRAEIESLLSYDSPSAGSLTRRVSDAAQEALRWSDGPLSRCCGPYRLVRLLGRGGMGAVYLGERRDGEIEQRVAIKLLRADADRPSWRDRFLKERQLLAYLNHASIARLLDAGHTEVGQPYLVMEYVDGVAIDDYVARLDVNARLKLFLLVCDGVSHAHQQLIIHRDLKPSNILVDSSGQPKLLDFGIAKLLDAVTGEARTVERLLTPEYASPEQLQGGVQTTATDIYSLGAVLYRLLTGRSPRDPDVSTAAQELIRPSRLNSALPRDIDHILRKALRHEPSERYTSVSAFADDIRALLESRPVQARAADVWYRSRKFVRRYRPAVAAATITIVGLLFGLNVAAHQRVKAQTRSQQVRQLATRVLALDAVARDMHNPPKGMHEIVAISKEHLETLVAEAHTDQNLALEVVDAWSLLARAQGISTAASAEQRADAEVSLQKAAVLVEPVLRRNPHHRHALLTAARISHDRMIVAENDRRRSDAVARARQAAGYLERLLELGSLSAGESETASELFYNIALSQKNMHLLEDGIRFARRAIETSRSLPTAQLRLSLALSMLADLLRFTGDLDGALAAIREARVTLDKVRFRTSVERRSAWCRVLGREGKILGQPDGISFARSDEAIVVLQKTFDLLEEWTQSDQDDAWSRLLFISVGREFGAVLTLREPGKAAAVYDHALQRIREVRNNPEARRGEAETLAASTYALRRLNRADEARARLDTAFRLLAETRDYPSARIVLYEAPHVVLRALGDHLAETGQPQRAAEVYEDLLAKIMLSKPDIRGDLAHALELSHIYGALAPLYRRTGQSDGAQEMSGRRLELWLHWDRRLPRNGFVRRQLESARRQYRPYLPGADLDRLASQAGKSAKTAVLAAAAYARPR
jgi:tetratricopeptide (TPR) repeat protein